ncbi:uncharacterized protein LOC141668633 [Apium graveolens]|uniref:uncharacterized protein LOC141668633 n=1 Tax=Apium graveolens TaxID=4045 RepID=UPI003D79BFEB
MSPFQLVYGKACHLPTELEHRAYWVLKKLDLDMVAAGEKRMLQPNKLDEFHLRAYENNKVYKEKVKRWHDRRLVRKSFVPDQQVLLFNARLRLFPGKIKSRWSGPFIVKVVFPQGAMEIFDKHPDQAFMVNASPIHYPHPNLYSIVDMEPKRARTAGSSSTHPSATEESSMGGAVNRFSSPEAQAE